MRIRATPRAHGRSPTPSRPRTRGWKRVESMVTSAVNGRGAQYGVLVYRHRPTSRSSRSARRRPTWRRRSRDTLPAHLGGFAKTGAGGGHSGGRRRPMCHAHQADLQLQAQRVALVHLMANELDETTTIQDGVSTFKAPEGPSAAVHHQRRAIQVVQGEPVYQLSTIHLAASAQHAGDRRGPGRRRARPLGVTVAIPQRHTCIRAPAAGRLTAPLRLSGTLRRLWTAIPQLVGTSTSAPNPRDPLLALDRSCSSGDFMPRVAPRAPRPRN